MSKTGSITLSPTFSVSAAGLGSLPGIFDLERNSFPAGHARLSREQLEAYLAQSICNAANAGNKKRPLLTAFVPEIPQPVGYCYGRINDEGHDIAVGVGGQIVGMAVDNTFRRMGIASELLDRVCRSLKEGGAEHITLFVNPKNKPAVQLFTGYGFVETNGRVPHYYGPDMAAVVMSLNF